MKQARASRPRLVPLNPSQLTPLLLHLPDDRLAVLVGGAGSSWRAAQDQWGLCGVALLGDDQAPAAAALVCPALHLPHGHPLQEFGRTPDAAQLVAVSAPGPEPQRAMRWMVQRLARSLVRQASALEACGSTVGDDVRQPPVAALEACGFRRVEERGGSQRMRLDLDATLSWPSLGQTWDAVRCLLPRPIPPTEPTGRDLRREPPD